MFVERVESVSAYDALNFSDEFIYLEKGVPVALFDGNLRAG